MSEARARLDALPAQYPRLFPRGPLHWGFEVGDGWSDIIVALCARINALLEESPGASLCVKQVKEKFGGLRFYYDLRGANEPLIIALDEAVDRSEEHTSELQSLMRISYAVFCLKKKTI